MIEMGTGTVPIYLEPLGCVFLEGSAGYATSAVVVL
jgi:hypothetical protein